MRRLTNADRAIRIASLVLLAAGLASGCAAGVSLRAGERAERAQDFDRAVVEYTTALRANPDDQTTRLALDRARIKAAQQHFFQGRRFVEAERYQQALAEFQLASELNPTDGEVMDALRSVRQTLRTKVAVSREGKTQLEALIERSRDQPTPGQELPADARLPESLVFSNASSRAIFRSIAQLSGMSVVFDPGFREETISVDLRNQSLADALGSVTAASRTFYRVTQRTLTIIPDTPGKRREYEESVVRTIYLSNADLKEVIDLLRLVVDVRQITGLTAINAIALQDTAEQTAAAARLIAAIDKARPEVVIDVELLEVDRTRLRQYGLQIASPGSPDGISGSLDVNRDGLSLQNLASLTRADVFATGVPGVYYRLLKSDGSTRILANPQLRTSEGIAAQAKFGEEVPVPVTVFAPIASGGINQQPITSFTYRNIGVNIDITPRTHHDDEVSLALKIELSSISGTGFGDLPTFGTRQITTTIRLKDGETNMLAGLIRDEERTTLSGIPGLSDLPLLGRLFANTRKSTQQTDIILTLTPHIVRVLDVTEEDLRPLRLGRSSSGELRPPVDLPQLPPRDRDPVPGASETPAAVPAPTFPQPLQAPLPGILPGTSVPVPPLPKKGGGGGSD